jgi:acyl-CoA synthetase (AMP-forming)/AMP-acid ligase II
MVGQMNDWGDLWPEMRAEAHFGDRVVACFQNRPQSLYALLHDAAQTNPSGEALVCGSERLGYAELLKQSSQLATGLARRGIKAGDRVAMLLGNRNEFVVTLFALAHLGAIAVPISIREQAPGLAYMLSHCAAVMVVHEADLTHLLPSALEAPALKYRVAVSICEGSELLSSLLVDGDPPPVQQVAEEETAVILYTSGTTGRPKGAMLTHLGIVHSSMHFQIAMDLKSSDASIAAVPLSHVTGLIALITTLTLAAGKLVIMPSFKAADFLILAEREGMTHTLMVPAMYNLCLLQSDFDKYNLSRWRIGAFGGAPMPVSTIERLAQTVPALMLMNCYGSTESTSPATLMPSGQTAAHNDTVGLPLACVEMRIMDDSGREVPPNVLGEIWIKGPQVVPGYWDNPVATKENFTAGFWHSGDMGSMDALGYVKVVDRKKDMINRGGYKIYTIEVENALYAHPAVQECAVVSKPCPVLGERVHAFVMLKTAGSLEDELLDFCKSRLSDYKVPESFTLSSTPLPRNANGKLVKKEMRDQLLKSLASINKTL